MCLISFALNYHPVFPLVLIANRDEFYDRPTAPAGFWEDRSFLLGGRDLKGGGTWMGLTTNGRFAAITNYRDLTNINPAARSRGELPVKFLEQKLSGLDYLQSIHPSAKEYNGFNLLTYSRGEAAHYSNYEGRVNHPEPGIHGLSNALLNTSWPKVERIKSEFRSILSGDWKIEDFWKLLGDEERAEDNLLPDTGVSAEWEKALSAICIRTETYGTCSSTIVTITKDGQVNFWEKSYAVGQREEKIRHYEFEIEKKID